MSECVSGNTSSRKTVRKDDSAIGQLTELQGLIEERKSAVAKVEELDAKIAKKRSDLRNVKSSSDLKSLLMNLLGIDTQDKDKEMYR